MSYEYSAVTMARNLETLVSKSYAMTWVLNTSFRVRIRIPEWCCGKEKQNLV
jgi:hypothetical protein